MKLSDLLTTYITRQQQAGRDFRNDAMVLRAFGRAMGDIDVADVDRGAVSAFVVGSGPPTAYSTCKYRILGGLYRFALAHGHADTCPLPPTVPKAPPPLTPYIYSCAEISRMLKATDSLATPTSPLQATTVRVLLLLLYGAALRIGEALSLTVADVDLVEHVLTVRGTKFYKTRLVPVGPRMAAHLSAYAKRRCLLPLPSGDASSFFATRTGRRLHYSGVNALFGRVRRLADIHREKEARYQPRMHDLRHTAVVHRVVHWYRTGKHVSHLLPQLATYLGHVDIASTQRYLSMTPELLQEASFRFAGYARLEVTDE